MTRFKVDHANNIGVNFHFSHQIADLIAHNHAYSTLLQTHSDQDAVTTTFSNQPLFKSNHSHDAWLVNCTYFTLFSVNLDMNPTPPPLDNMSNKGVNQGIKRRLGPLLFFLVVASNWMILKCLAKGSRM